MMELSPELQVVRDFFIALMIGALVGVEREKRKAEKHEIAFGGLRTFILFAEAGAVSAWLSLQLGSPWLFVVTILAVAVVVAIAYVLESQVRPDALGLTTELAAITVCLLGGAVMYGYAELAVGLGIVTASVLAFKQPLHGLVQKLGMDDIYAVLKLLIATFIVLPVLPHRPIDPWGALDPWELWLLVIVISALSLAGYVAVRWLGRARGTVLTGLAGGLASSTAVSVAFARESRGERRKATVDALAAGILAAWTVMFARIVVVVAIVSADLVPALVIECSAMAAISATAAAWFYVRHGREQQQDAAAEDVALNNPFSLWSATKFSVLFAVVLLVVELVGREFEAAGLYVVAALAGLTDVDAITMSMARTARADGGAAALAAGTILVAAVSNTVAKYAMVALVGSADLRRRLLVPAGLLVAAGAVAVVLG